MHKTARKKLLNSLYHAYINSEHEQMVEMSSLVELDNPELASEKSLDQQRYPGPVGRKFTPDGAVKYFPGNTLIVHLSRRSPLCAVLEAMYDDIRQQDFASSIALLPPSSWHMTVYDLVAYDYRTRTSLPADLPLDTPLRVVHGYMATQLANIKHGLGDDGVGQMTVAGYQPVSKVIAFRLLPTSDEKENALRALRDRLSAKLKMRKRDHDEYEWHLTFAYILRFWTAEEEEAKIREYLDGWLARLSVAFEFGIPEFCVFDNMSEFRRVFYVG